MKKGVDVERMHDGILGKKCTVCGEVKHLEQFYKSKRNNGGVTADCKKCCLARKHRDRERTRSTPKVIPEFMTCMDCKQVLCSDEFSDSEIIKRGKVSTCKKCRNEWKQNYKILGGEELAAKNLLVSREFRKHNPYNKVSYEKRKKESQKHREKYPEQYRALSRIRSGVKSGKTDKGPCVVCGEDEVWIYLIDADETIFEWRCFKHHLEIRGKEILRGLSQ